MSHVPLDLDESRIVGDDLEAAEMSGNYITYDVRFAIYVPNKKNGQRVKILVNVEAQKKFYEKYSLVTRGVFYGSRMVSTQQGIEFKDSNYDDVKKVYSIWICLKAPLKVGNATTKYKVVQEKTQGNMEAKQQEYDKLNVIMVCLNENAEVQPKGLHHLLNVLFSNKIRLKEKTTILEEIYEMKMTKEIEEEVGEMCNWSEAFFDEGMELGIQQGICLLYTSPSPRD